MKYPWFAFYVNSWLSDTAILLMTPAQEGAYIRLLCHCWAAEDCGIPAKDDELAVLSRLGQEWHDGAGGRIKGCFKKVGDRLFNDKLLEIRNERVDWSEKSRKGGLTSAKKRKHSVLVGGKGGDKGGSTKRVTKPQPPRDSDSTSNSSCSLREEGSGEKPPRRASFDEFWKVYPRKVSKGAALKAWAKIKRPAETLELIRAALSWQVTTEEWRKKGGTFIPHPASYLNATKWEDEKPAAPMPGVPPEPFKHVPVPEFDDA